MKKALSIILSLSFLICSFVGCSRGDNNKNPTQKITTVRFLNFKPEIANVYSEISKVYEKETGVRLQVETAASGNYEQTLTAKMGTNEAPTLFQINGPVGYQNWKDYTLNLADTDLYANLSDKSLAITGEDGGVYGVPYTIEGYGIIYNDAIMQKYFATEGAKAASIDEINNYAKLKALLKRG